jgi:hypothetical protein
MAWTAPTQRSTGTLITAAIYNADIIDNITFLGVTHDHSGDSGDGGTLSGLPDADDYEKTVNSAAETVHHSYTIAANSMSDEGFFVVEWWVAGSNTSGAGCNIDFVVDFGATEIWAETDSMGNTEHHVSYIKIAVFNQAATGAQGVTIIWACDHGAAIDTAAGEAVTVHNVYYATAAEDTTGALTLNLSLQMSAAHANNWVESVATVLGPYSL